MPELTRNNGDWTEARFNSFVKSQLRGGTNRWGPKQLAKKLANIRRGWYLCAGCTEEIPTTLEERDKSGNRIKNVYVDHIDPVIDPAVGFTSWDDYIDRLYCEISNLQVLCKWCHDFKSKKERAIATIRRQKEKHGTETE